MAISLQAKLVNLLQNLSGDVSRISDN